MIQSIAKELAVGFEEAFVQTRHSYPIQHAITGQYTGAFTLVRTSALGRLLGRPLASEEKAIVVEGQRYKRSAQRNRVEKTGKFGLGRDVSTFFEL